MRAFLRYRQQIEFSEGARGLTQSLRLTPRGFDSLHVTDWFVGVEPDARLRRSEDAFGNIVHSCSHDGPLERTVIFAEGEIETSDSAGVVSGQAERFPLDVFLRDTDATHADAALRAFVAETLAAETEPLGRMHALMGALNDRLVFEPGETAAPRSAAATFKSGAGSARELAQVLVAAARADNAPARFISGFFLGEDADAGVHHAWAEAYVEPFGWIGFDSALGYCPRGEHIRIGQGLDYFGAAPRRAANFAFTTENATVELNVEQIRQASWQDQQ